MKKISEKIQYFMMLSPAVKGILIVCLTLIILSSMYFGYFGDLMGLKE